MKKQILFVDDEPDMLASLRTMLRSMRSQWDMQFVTDGAEAIKRIEQIPFDVVVSDMRMPVVDGAQVLEAARLECPGAVRIILSGVLTVNDALRTAKSAHQFISKPVDTKKLVDVIVRVLKLRSVFLNQNVATAVSHMKSLPAIPDVSIRLESELTSSSPSLKHAGEIIGSDMGMSASILKLVNSSFFGLPNTIASPVQAATYLGMDTLRGLVLSTHLFDNLQWEWPDFSLAALWGHCMQVGQFCRLIATAQGVAPKDQGPYFLAGLLHDVGKLILAVEYKDRYGAVLSKVKKEDTTIYEEEMEQFGLSHAQTGAYLLGLWGFDPQIVKAISFHHQLHDLPSCEMKDEFCPAIAVHVANALEHELVRRRRHNVRSSLDLKTLEALNLADRVPLWRETCAAKLEQGATQ